MLSSANPVPALQVENLAKDYQLGSTVVHALQGVTMSVMPGEFLAVMGPSGSGKSTFMNMVGCLDRPTRGRYLLNGVPVEDLSKDELAAIRNLKIGFVFQGFNLLSRMTAVANVELPMMYAGIPSRERRRRALEALHAVAMDERADHRPSELSGGQQQRVAIARALVNNPTLLLADEPTGNLDTRTSIELMVILQKLSSTGITILMVTHEPDIARYARRNVFFRDGRIRQDIAITVPRTAADDLQAMALSEETPEAA